MSVKLSSSLGRKATATTTNISVAAADRERLTCVRCACGSDYNRQNNTGRPSVRQATINSRALNTATNIDRPPARRRRPVAVSITARRLVRRATRHLPAAATSATSAARIHTAPAIDESPRCTQTRNKSDRN